MKIYLYLKKIILIRLIKFDKEANLEKDIYMKMDLFILLPKSHFSKILKFFLKKTGTIF